MHVLHSPKPHYMARSPQPGSCTAPASHTAPACLLPAGPRAKVADRDMEMEVSFVPGLEGLGAKLLAKKQEEKQRAGETVWEAYMRRCAAGTALACWLCW